MFAGHPSPVVAVRRAMAGHPGELIHRLSDTEPKSLVMRADNSPYHRGVAHQRLITNSLRIANVAFARYTAALPLP